METKILLRKIKREFPEIKWKSVKRTKENWGSDVIILDDKYVFRFARGKGGTKKFVEEIKLLDYLKSKTSIAVPDYIFRSKDGKFAGYKIINGGKLMPNEFKKLSRQDKEKMALQFAGFLNILHTIPKRFFKKFGVEIKSKGSGIDRQYKKIRKTIFPKLSDQEVRDIKEFFRQYKAIVKKQYKKVLVHGDFTKENIIYQKGRITGVIDFTDFDANEPALDFKGFCDFGSEFAEMVYKNYNDKGDKLFLERSKLYYRMIGLYVLDGAVNDKHSPFDFEECHKRFRKFFYN